jgi:hypothetical protein
MEYELRMLTDNDYDMLRSWWKWFRFPAPKDYLPEDGRGGILVSKMGTNLCGFYFLITLKLLG